MKVFITLTLVLVALCCAAALVVSVYPGVLNDLAVVLLLSGIIALPVVGVLGVVVVIVAWRRRWRPRFEVPWRRAALIPLLLLLTLVALKWSLPRRVAWPFSQSSFEELLPTATTEPNSPGHRLGLYTVDQYALDPRGGVYFRVHAGRDGFGPDTMSYGFVYQPNAAGTPFGAAAYRVHRLGGDWAWFRASNDWF